MKRCVAAVVCWLVFALFHFAGLRGEVSALSLTAPAGQSLEVALLGAALYLAAYFAATLVAPVLVLSVMLERVLRRLPLPSGEGWGEGSSHSPFEDAPRTRTRV